MIRCRPSAAEFPPGWFLVLCCLVAPLAGGREVRGGEAAPTPAHLIPAKGLTTYGEYDGLGTHQAAWKATAAREILETTGARDTMMASLKETLARLFQDRAGGQAGVGDLIALQEHLTHAGFAVAAYEAGKESTTVTLLNGFGEKPTLDDFLSSLRFVLDPSDGREFPARAKMRGRDVNSFRRDGFGGFTLPGVRRTEGGVTWWVEGSTLILVGGPPGELLVGDDEENTDRVMIYSARVDSILDAIEGKTPNATSHAGIAAARAEGLDLDGFEPAGLFVVESTKQDSGVLGALREQSGGVGGSANELDITAVLGLNESRRILGRWGFRGKALLTDVRFESGGHWKGVAGMLDPTGFRKDPLAPLPRRMGAFAAGLFSHPLDGDSIATWRGALTDNFRPLFEAAREIHADPENLRQLDTLFGTIGPTWYLYASPGGKPSGEGFPALRVEVKDREAFGLALDSAAARLNAYLRAEEGDAGNAKPGDPPRSLLLEPLAAPERGYRLASPEGRVPWLNDELRPTILLGHSCAVVAATPELAREAIAAEAQDGTRRVASAEEKRLFECLPERLTFLSVGDPRDSSWPELFANLPALTGKLLGTEGRPGPSGLLSLLGVRAGRAGARKPIKAEDVRALIFPSVLAGTLDDRGLRVITLEAFPFGCIWGTATYKVDGKSKSLQMGIKFGPEK